MKAPFTDEQVRNLNDYQRASFMHPFTCGVCSDDLIAEREGWRCPTPGCTYTQDWAHDFMADGSWRESWRGLHDAFGIDQPQTK